MINHDIIKIFNYVGMSCSLCDIVIIILLDVLLPSIAEYFYELCRILTSPLGESKYKQQKRLIRDLLSNTLNCYVVQLLFFVRFI